MQVKQNAALYALLGTKFGGNGQTTFNLPDLRGRVAVDAGVLGTDAYAVGNAGGAETVTLTKTQIPYHNHLFNCTDTIGNKSGIGTNTDKFLLASPEQGKARYGGATKLQPMAVATVLSAGGDQPHSNCQPSLVLNPCIATTGIFPPHP